MGRSVMTYLRSTISSWMLLSLFVGYVCGITLFMHSHIINGEEITHSHFYNGSAEQPNHTHTQQQAKVISALSVFVAEAASTPLFQSSTVEFSTSFSLDKAYGVVQQCCQHFSLRAPPAVI